MSKDNGKISNLAGKIAVVTGGGGVLCGEMARELGNYGVKVAVLNRGVDKGEKVAEAIRAAGGEAFAKACNVLVEKDLQAAATEIKKRWGGIDILVNGAGGNDPRASTSEEIFDRAATSPVKSAFFDLDPQGFREVFDLNFMGSFLPSQVFVPLMLGRPGATIVNVSSMSAYAPMTKVPAYSAAKAAINNFTQWMAVHFAEAGLRVNAIAPGFFSTDQNKKLLWNPDGSPSARTQKIIQHTPMRRLGEAKDLVGTLIWLCDNEASGFVTGAVIPVDGGFMAYSGV